MTRLSIHKKILLLISLQTLIIVTFFLYSTANIFQNKFKDCLSQNNYISSTMVSDFSIRTETGKDISAFPVIQIPGSSQDIVYQALSQNTFLSDYGVNKTIADTVIPYINSSKFIHGISIYDLSGTGIYCESNKFTYFLYNTNPEKAWFQQTMKGNGSALIFPSESLSSAIMMDSYTPCYYIARAVMNVERYRPVGIVVISMSISDLDEYFSTVRQFSNQKLSLLYENQKISGNLEADNEILKTLENSDLSYTIKKEPDGLTLYQLSQSGSYQVLVSTPLSNIWNSISHINILFFILLGCLLLFTIIFFYLILRSIHRPISRLAEACDQLKLDYFPTVSDKGLSPELYTLSTSFNHMSKRIEYLINKILKKDIFERDLELQLLRTQINPHYLYNTLECMRMEAYIKEDFKVSEMAQLLGRNLQYGLRDTGAEVPLSQELSHLQEYIKLVLYHYENAVHVNICIPEELLKYKTIKLLFQPLVENAVVHGTKQKPCIDIDILGYEEGNTLFFTVSDNGSGMPESQLKALNDQLNDSSLSTPSIGLKNINRRLSLYYGEAYGLKIHSVYSIGTTITVSIPAKL
ncbi:MAG: histidine kinase [Lachnoclostridium edouardi]|uniref:sensor histidine kinase n=1 Tax=Lachnoclostridium edouardi TaxID=1926283 RepID=UPI0026DC8626|nr:sensor histidine kinase [Lachnoclostridium edouardi]MDO4278092.1 histidine kinase [Lachnoclostridium edouardi]